MSNMAGEMENPQIIPKAMRISQPLIALTYVLPTLAALAAIGQWNAWSTDQGAGMVGYADVLIQYVGQWAGVLFVIIAIISNMGIFCSYIAHGSRAFFVMADDDMFPKALCKVDKRGIPTLSILILAVFTVICCQFDFTTLVMAATPIQLYLYLLMVACIYKVRKMYPVEGRRKMGLTVMPGGNIGLAFLSACVILICMFAIYANGTDYFVTGYVVLGLGLVMYIAFKWLYKGDFKKDPVAFPLNQTTKLGVGDMRDIGVYTLLVGLMSLIGYVFLLFYEGEEAYEYYLEEYGTGLFSNYGAMMHIVLGLGIVLTIVGFALYKYGMKTESAQIADLAKARKERLDEEIKELIGGVPGQD